MFQSLKFILLVAIIPIGLLAKTVYLTIGSLDANKTKYHCVAIPESLVRSLAYKLDCADYTAKIRKYSGNMDYYKCEKGDDFYITRDGQYSDKSKVSSKAECKKINKKVLGYQTSKTLPADIIPVSQCKEMMKSHPSGYALLVKKGNCKDYRSKEVKMKEYFVQDIYKYFSTCPYSENSARFIEYVKMAVGATECKKDDRFNSSSIEKYNCKDHFGTSKAYYNVTAANQKECTKVVTEYVKAEKEENKRIAQAEAEAKKDAIAKAKSEDQAKKLAIAKSNGFTTYKAYQNDLAKKAEIKRVAEIKNKRIAREKKVAEQLALAKSNGYSSYKEYQNYLFAKSKGYSSYKKYIKAENMYTAEIGCKASYTLPWVSCIEEVKLNGRIENNYDLQVKYGPRESKITKKLSTHFDLMVTPSGSQRYYVKIVNNLTGEEVFYDEKNNKYSVIRIKN